MTPNTLCELIYNHLPYGGVTISKAGKVLTEGIAVAPSKTTEYKFPYLSESYVKARIETWVWLRDKNLDIGLWVDQNDIIYLDQIKVYHSYDLTEAVQVALNANQEAIQLLNPNITLRIG